MHDAGVTVFHLHPLQRCNLRCLHCYSDSSPQASAMLDRDGAVAAVTMAARWGYRVLAISGGEPMLYPHLGAILALAADAGMATSLVTNGLLCHGKAATDTLRCAGTVTVSLDGLAARHDHLRQRRGAFAGAGNAIRRLADAGIVVWVACGLTADNLDDIEELAATAACWGACGIAFHPVEPAGRAVALPGSLFLTAEQRLLAYVTVTLLAARHGPFKVRLDLLHREVVLRQPALLYANGQADAAEADGPPAAALQVLVMYPDGTLMPVCHGFSDRYALGHVDDGDDRLRTALFQRTRPALDALGRAALAALRADPALRLVNPGDWLAARSQHAGALPRQAAPA